MSNDFFAENEIQLGEFREERQGNFSFVSFVCGTSRGLPHSSAYLMWRSYETALMYVSQFVRERPSFFSLICLAAACSMWLASICAY